MGGEALATFDFEKAYDWFSRSRKLSEEGSEEWQLALFGMTTGACQRTPGNTNQVESATRDLETLIDKVPESTPMSLRAKVTLGQIAEQMILSRTERMSKGSGVPS